MWEGGLYALRLKEGGSCWTEPQVKHKHAKSLITACAVGRQDKFRCKNDDSWHCILMFLLVLVWNKQNRDVTIVVLILCHFQEVKIMSNSFSFYTLTFTLLTDHSLTVEWLFFPNKWLLWSCCSNIWKGSDMTLKEGQDYFNINYRIVCSAYSFYYFQTSLTNIQQCRMSNRLSPLFTFTSLTSHC